MRSRFCRSARQVTHGRDGRLLPTSLRLMARINGLSISMFGWRSRWPDDAIEVQTRERVPTTEPHHLLVDYDGSGKASGIKLYVDGKLMEQDVLQDQLSGDFRTAAPLEIGDKSRGIAFEGRLDDLRIYNRTLSPSEAEDVAIRLPVRALLMPLAGRPALEFAELQPEKPAGDVQIGTQEKAQTKEESEKGLERSRQALLTEYFLDYAAPENERQLYAQLKGLQAEKAKLETAIPTVMIMAEMKKPRETFVLGRGQYDNPKEKVTAGVPAVLPPMAPGLPMNRLGLAKWIVDPANPLTARVAVNRFWQEYLRYRHRQDLGGLRIAGRAPQPPLTARLARH